jgi:CubicO group peptidase (beta-lactamase class C family)
MPEHAFGTLTALVEDKPLASVALPDPAAERSRALMEIEVHCAPSVFAGAEFPPCGPAQTGSVEDLIGPYEIKTTYYDRDYRIVAAAEKPGRYGAVIDLIPEQGRRVRRFRTLYCQPEGLDWWSYEMKAAAEFPGALGLDPGAVSGQSRLVGEYFKWLLVDSFYRSDQTAPLLAGLAEAEPGAGDPGLSGDAAALDRQWWVGLKRKLYGAEAGQAQTFLAPRPNPGRRAPALRDGSAAEAGLHPDSVAAIDALLGRWAADSDEAFAVLIARRGVVALHKAYGTRQDRPMSVDDPSWMASITKLLSGTLMLLLVDQDLVSLDDPVDRFIPALRGIAVEKPLTIRHLYTHTNGLWGHWGDDLHDFEEIVADYYPYLEVGKNHSYNGAGYALDGKVIEMVSGEALPQFYKEHLLDPLGCAHTYVTDTSGGARSVPLDIARIGQLLLNRGAYGDLEFFREETYAQLLPVRLAAILGPGTQIEWGIGATWFRGEGLGEGTFGHGAASSATLRIDPANELVVVMTRNAAGRRFNEYHPRFLAAVAGALLAEKSPDKMGGKAPERTELAREE